MIVDELMTEIRLALSGSGIGEALLESELIVMRTLGLNRAGLYSDPGRPITKAEDQLIREDLRRRLNGEPWPYICGYREFYGLYLRVCEGVFIPRPETELIVDLALEFAGKSRTRSLKIVDIGTGSGAIAVSIAVHLRGSIIYGTDISGTALTTAKLNAEDQGVAERIILLKGDLLAGLNESVNMVVSNPPYIPRKNLSDLSAEIRHEPMEALYGGEDGLDIIREIIPTALSVLTRPGQLIMEIFPYQFNEIRNLVSAHVTDPDIRCHKDLAGINRVVVVSL